MDRRRLLLILAVFVAIIGTALVFHSVQGADKRASDKVANIQVLQATQAMAAGEKYDDALAAGKISLQEVPKNVAVLNVGYQSSTDALKGEIAQVPIFPGQVIVTSQFGNSVAAASSSLPIPKGMMAISVNLTDPDRVAGNIQNGSDVAIFVTGTLTGTAGGGTSTTTGATDAQSTRLLLPKVTVLNIGSPQPATTSTSTDENGTQTTEQLPRTLLTLAVDQKEAQKVILASKALNLTFGLLTPDSKVSPKAPGTSTLIQSLFAK
jgi:pilus assembly protein CpaB